jgi:hypothetical protein
MAVLKGPKDRQIEREDRRLVFQGWLIVIGLALAVSIYGVFMYFAVGDKGPPDWDFGIVEDIPGQSIYSTNPAIPGPAGIPQPQHVREKPPLAEIDVSKQK